MLEFLVLWRKAEIRLQAISFLHSRAPLDQAWATPTRPLLIHALSFGLSSTAPSPIWAHLQGPYRHGGKQGERLVRVPL